MNEVFSGDKARQNGVSTQHFLLPASGVDVMISSLYLYTQLLPEPGVLPGGAWWAVITPTVRCLT